MNSIGFDFHSHDPEALHRSLTPGEYAARVKRPGQKLTVGIHPWDTDREDSGEWDILERALGDRDVVAVGEVGIDPLRGGDPERQLVILRRQLTMAAEARLPVVFHIVRRYDILMKLYREFRPEQPWGVHGFRGKPETARMLAERGIYMSLGLRFNPESARIIPDNLLLVETDDLSADAIGEVVVAVAEARGVAPQEIERLAAGNLARFFASGSQG